MRCMIWFIYVIFVISYSVSDIIKQFDNNIKTNVNVNNEIIDNNVNLKKKMCKQEF